MLSVNNIQHFSIHDGNGIRTTVFLQGCNLHCKWCHNVETICKNGGTPMSEQAVLTELLEDALFYQNSSGGVTFSGGEPLLQTKELVKLLVLCKQHNLNIAIDTAGSLPFSNFELVLPYVDTFLYDIKCNNPLDYHTHTGGNFDLIIANLLRLQTYDCQVIIRIPIIPKLSDSPTYHQIVSNLLPRNCEINLLPFHSWGESKYKKLGIPYDYQSVLPPTNACMQTIKKVYEQIHSLVIIK